MSKTEQLETFNKFITANYDKFKGKMQKMCHLKHLTFDEDVLQDTLCKIIVKINKSGLTANTPKGIENYVFRAFVLNTYQMHLQNQKRREDYNVDLRHIVDEDGKYNEKTDLAIEYLTSMVVMEFPEEETNLWRLKYQNEKNLTYQDIKRLTGNKTPRKIITNINRWLIDHVNPNLLKNIGECPL